MKQWLQRLTWRELFPLVYMLAISACSATYGLVNSADRPIHIIKFGIDDYIPFWEAFIIPYIIWGPFIFISLVFMCFLNREEYYKYIVNSVVGHIICYIVYINYQTHVPRPEITDDTFLLNLVKYIYSNDLPYNCFPSIHVLTTWLLMRSFQKVAMPKLLRLAINILCYSIYLSTLFVKQHYIPDLIIAIILGEALIFATNAAASKIKEKRAARSVYLAKQKAKGANLPG
ncbi:phosphatase PAP2 family protein [Marinicrinis lubricantis]|uniref:Phosphatase PAP2 family protein n=1 Tax=Marinicrinis lubricantis TaxID=2086470 RepID=A0ABW1ILE0_9BACL